MLRVNFCTWKNDRIYSYWWNGFDSKLKLWCGIVRPVGLDHKRLVRVLIKLNEWNNLIYNNSYSLDKYRILKLPKIKIYEFLCLLQDSISLYCTKFLKLIDCNKYTSSSQCQFNIGNLLWVGEINLTTRWHVIRADVRVGPGRRRSWLHQSPGTMWENQSGKRYMSGEQLLSVVPSVDETHILNCELSVRHNPPDRLTELSL